MFAQCLPIALCAVRAKPDIFVVVHLHISDAVFFQRADDFLPQIRMNFRLAEIKEDASPVIDNFAVIGEHVFGVLSENIALNAHAFELVPQSERHSESTHLLAEGAHSVGENFPVAVPVPKHVLCRSVCIAEPAVIHHKILAPEPFCNGQHFAQPIKMRIAPGIAVFVVQDGQIILGRFAILRVVIRLYETVAGSIQSALDHGEEGFVRAKRLAFRERSAPVRREKIPHAAAQRKAAVAEDRLEDPGGGGFHGDRPAHAVRKIFQRDEGKLSARRDRACLAPFLRADPQSRPGRLKCKTVGGHRIQSPLSAPVVLKFMKNQACVDRGSGQKARYRKG